MNAILYLPLVTLDYSVAAVGAVVMMVALVILAEFALPENSD